MAQPPLLREEGNTLLRIHSSALQPARSVADLRLFPTNVPHFSRENRSNLLILRQLSLVAEVH